MRTSPRHLVKLARRYTTHALLATNMTRDATCQTPNDFERSLTQKRIAKKLLDGYFVLLTGDLNDSSDTHSFNVCMTENQLTNPIQAALVMSRCSIREMPTRKKLKNTTIDHVLHTPLLDNIVLQQISVCM
jgi:predicted ABC-class ATPase